MLRALGDVADDVSGKVDRSTAAIDKAGESATAAAGGAEAMGGSLGQIGAAAGAAAIGVGLLAAASIKFTMSSIDRYGELVDKIREVQAAQGTTFGNAAAQLGLNLTDADAAKVDAYRAQVAALGRAVDDLRVAAGSGAIQIVGEFAQALTTLAEKAADLENKIHVFTWAFHLLNPVLSVGLDAVNRFGDGTAAAVPKMDDAATTARKLADAFKAAHDAAVSGFAAMTGPSTAGPLKDATDRLAALARKPAEIAAANAAAVASAVSSANSAVASATRGVEDANRRAEDAARGVADAENDAADAIARAREQSERAELSASRRLRDAANRLTDVRNAIALEGGGADTSKLRDALIAVGDAQTDLSAAQEDGAKAVEQAQADAADRVEQARRAQEDAARGVAEANGRLAESHNQVATAATKARQSLPPDFLDQVKKATDDVAAATFAHALMQAETSHNAAETNAILTAGQDVIARYGGSVGLTNTQLWTLNQRLERAKDLIAQTAGFTGFSQDPNRAANIAASVAGLSGAGSDLSLSPPVPVAAGGVTVNVQGSLVTERELAATLAQIRTSGVGSRLGFG